MQYINRALLSFISITLAGGIVVRSTTLAPAREPCADAKATSTVFVNDIQDDDASVYFAEDLTSAKPIAAKSTPTTNANSSADDLCSGCDFTIDLRCKGLRFGRIAFFHKITQCLLPAYGLISKARQHASGQRCMLTWTAMNNLEPLLSVLAPDLSAVRRIDEDTPCAAKIKHYVVQPEWRFGFSCDWIRAYAEDQGVIGVYLIDISSNGAAMRNDAASHHGRERLMLLIQRNGTRAFTADASHALARELRQVAQSLDSRVMRTRYAEYKGTESASDTMKLFADAAGVAGYHGAGFANVLFTGHEVCAQEITVWQDADSTKLWRSINLLTQLNPRLHWNTYALPLSELLEANNVQEKEASQDLDQLIKVLPWVHLTSLHASLVAHQLSTCLDLNLQDAD